MDRTKDIVGGSACIYERSGVIKYALGNSNKLLCSLCNDLPFSSCNCRASTRDGGSHLRPG
jgi:hypothetical protein